MRILIIEDQKKTAQFIQKGLSEQGYLADVVNNGLDAESQARHNEYDLIILDVMLPGQDGMQICQNLRRMKVMVPILMLTALDSTEDKVKGLDSGADDYLSKPFEFGELLARIRALTRRYRSASPQLKVGDLELDITTRKASRGGREISLTAKEFALLEYLMQHAGQVVTRTAISEHVWDIHFDTESNVIDVYINFLRKKIDKGHKEPLLHTVVGAGYVLKAPAGGRETSKKQ
jgi:two-component system, OmpR family, copper resistance phosphate regulon response regulator CusR